MASGDEQRARATTIVAVVPGPLSGLGLAMLRVRSSCMRRCQWTGIRLLLSSVRQAHDYAEGTPRRRFMRRGTPLWRAHTCVWRDNAFWASRPLPRSTRRRRSYYTRRSHRLAVARPARRLGPCAPRSWLPCRSRCAKVRPGGPTGRRPSFELNVSPRRRARVASCRSRRRVAAAGAGGTA